MLEPVDAGLSAVGGRLSTTASGSEKVDHPRVHDVRYFQGRAVANSVKDNEFAVRERLGDLLGPLWRPGVIVDSGEDQYRARDLREQVERAFTGHDAQHRGPQTPR